MPFPRPVRRAPPSQWPLWGAVGFFLFLFLFWTEKHFCVRGGWGGSTPPPFLNVSLDKNWKDEIRQPLPARAAAWPRVSKAPVTLSREISLSLFFKTREAVEFPVTDPHPQRGATSLSHTAVQISEGRETSFVCSFSGFLKFRLDYFFFLFELRVWICCFFVYRPSLGRLCLTGR